MVINEEIDGYIDFDGTLIEGGIFNNFFSMAMKHQQGKKRIYKFYKNQALYILKEIQGKNSEEPFKNMVSVLEDISYFAIKGSIENIQLRNLSKIEKILMKGKKKLRILSKNDAYWINDVLESQGLRKQLYDKYHIEISGKMITNNFKQEKGIFTGEVKLRVNNKMEHLKQHPELPFFSDLGDWFSCRNYSNFVMV